MNCKSINWMNVTDKQKSECRALWKNCFGDSNRYMDYYFDEKCKESKVFLDIEDNHVVSMVYLNPYELMWQGQRIKSYYIVGVATEEKYRKQGRMRKLLEQAFIEMKEEIPFTYLMPANRKIYEPFGFETIYKQKRVLIKGIEQTAVEEVKAAELKYRNEFSPVIKKNMDELSEEELNTIILYCQEKLWKEFDLYAVRNAEYYQQLQHEMKAMEGNVAMFETEEGKVVGLIAYGLENGYLEAVETVIETEYTKEIIEELLKSNEIKDRSQIYFYETHFTDKEILAEIGTETEYSEKETTMVKLFAENRIYQELYGKSKVYLNELV